MVRNLLAVTDEEFLADSTRCWQEALKRGDMTAFGFWAQHSFSFVLHNAIIGEGWVAWGANA